MASESEPESKRARVEEVDELCRHFHVVTEETFDFTDSDCLRRGSVGLFTPFHDGRSKMLVKYDRMHACINLKLDYYSNWPDSMRVTAVDATLGGHSIFWTDQEGDGSSCPRAISFNLSVGDDTKRNQYRVTIKTYVTLTLNTSNNPASKNLVDDFRCAPDRSVLHVITTARRNNFCISRAIATRFATGSPEVSTPIIFEFGRDVRIRLRCIAYRRRELNRLEWHLQLENIGGAIGVKLDAVIPTLFLQKHAEHQLSIKSQENPSYRVVVAEFLSPDEVDTSYEAGHLTLEIMAYFHCISCTTTCHNTRINNQFIA